MLSPNRWMISVHLFVLAVGVCSSGCSLVRPKGKDVDSAALATVPTATSPSKAATATSQKLELAIALETADLARKRGMDDEAIAQYLAARQIDPQVKGVSHPLAVLYDRAGKMDAAQREYQAAIAEVGNSADLLCDYGYFLHSRGKHDEAETTLRAALKKNPQHQQAKINLGLVVGTLGKYDEAQKWFTEAIGPAAAAHNVGMLKLRAGDTGSAIEHLRVASSQDPSLSQSREVLAKLSGSH